MRQIEKVRKRQKRGRSEALTEHRHRQYARRLAKECAAREADQAEPVTLNRQQEGQK